MDRYVGLDRCKIKRALPNMQLTGAAQATHARSRSAVFCKAQPLDLE